MGAEDRPARWNDMTDDLVETYMDTGTLETAYAAYIEHTDDLLHDIATSYDGPEDDGFLAYTEEYREPAAIELMIGPVTGSKSGLQRAEPRTPAATTGSRPVRMEAEDAADPLDFEAQSLLHSAQTGFAAVKHEFADAYEEPEHAGHMAAEGVGRYAAGIRDDATAVEYLESFAVPLLRKHRGLPMGRDMPDLDTWEERLSRAYDDRYGNDASTDPRFHASLESGPFARFYDTVQKRYEPDAFDQVVGIYSSGLPFLYAATAHLEGDAVVLRYSQVRRNDDEVMITDTMEDRAAFDEADILVVDDCIASGDTMRTVGAYLYDRGAGTVTALVGEGEEHNVTPGTDGEIVVAETET